jgi:DNA-binding transcriptional MerR regulator
MKELYSIGEVSKIMGISVQALRYYSSINMLNPKYINPSTGYRYYSADQLHFIDRIKYLQKFGLSLEEIQEIIDNNDIQLLLSILEKRKSQCYDEINKLKETINGIEWYKNYFTYTSKSNSDDVTYTKYFKKRHMVATRIIENEPKEDFHIRLNTIKNSTKLKNLNYMRQFSYILNYESILKSTLNPTHLGMFIKESPTSENSNVLEIPEGNYLCFKSRILIEGWNPYAIKMFFNDLKEKPTLVLANEFENDLYEYSKCIYEIQILIPPSHPKSKKI